MIKAIFFDIDGTLLSYGTHRVLPSTIDAFDILRRKGIKTVISSGRPLMLIPQMVTFVPRVTYSMVTRDDALEKNTAYAVTETVNGEEVTHYYSRIVNTMNANPVTVTFEAGKKYTLLLRIGVEHISFEVVSVVDWDFPMRFDPQDVPGFTGETISHRLDEALD